MSRSLAIFLALFLTGNIALAAPTEVRVLGAKRVVSTRKTVTTAGTAVALSSTSQPCDVIMISGLRGNTGVILIGDSGVLATAGSAEGTVLYAGQTEYLPGGNLNAVFIDSAVNGEGVSFGCYTS